ncbi:MAG: hypothetical protein IKR73_09145 [Oscillospiraceae bacterium]|nr:hypothetical protein [Oscillospiraceae bacterium]
MMLFIFIIAVIGIGILTIKLKKRNREQFHQAFRELIDQSDSSGHMRP